jgi:hypothetical protein
LPQDNRRIAWEQFGTAVTERRWPPLKRSKTVLTAIAIIALVPLFIATSIGWSNAVLAAIVSAPALFFITRPLAVNLPGKLSTVEDLVRFTVGRGMVQPLEGWTPETIRAAVREIIIEQLSVSPDFSDDARFVEDLGLG